MKKAPYLSTCTCGHAGMRHKPDCRISGCDCEAFVQSVVRRDVDASWLQSAQPGKGKSKGKMSE